MSCWANCKRPGRESDWSTRGGGIERGETLLAALRRELPEAVGLEVDGEPPHVWTRRVYDSSHAPGYDGELAEHFPVRTASFQPHGAMSNEELAGEGISGVPLVDGAGDCRLPRGSPVRAA